MQFFIIPTNIIDENELNLYIYIQGGSKGHVQTAIVGVSSKKTVKRPLFYKKLKQSTKHK